MSRTHLISWNMWANLQKKAVRYGRWGFDNSNKYFYLIFILENIFQSLKLDLDFKLLRGTKIDIAFFDIRSCS